MRSLPCGIIPTASFDAIRIPAAVSTLDIVWTWAIISTVVISMISSTFFVTSIIAMTLPAVIVPIIVAASLTVSAIIPTVSTSSLIISATMPAIISVTIIIISAAAIMPPLQLAGLERSGPLAHITVSPVAMALLLRMQGSDLGRHDKLLREQLLHLRRRLDGSRSAHRKQSVVIRSFRPGTLDLYQKIFALQLPFVAPVQ
mmetsp:Transcript_28825/g.69441  ORF Transcript_28825/g.69441 Transcript_28825/m.69441 type:complete len:201 (-) Transcript_28825:935-1537(-)